MPESVVSILSLPSEVLLAIFESPRLKKLDLKNVRLVHRKFKEVAGSVLFSSLRISFSKTRYQQSQATSLPKLNGLIATLGHTSNPSAPTHIPRTLRELSISLPDHQADGFEEFIIKAGGSSSFLFYFSNIQKLRLNIRMSGFMDLPNNGRPTRLQVNEFLSVILARQDIIGSIELRANWRWLKDFKPSKLCSLMLSHDICENNRHVPKGHPMAVLTDTLEKSEGLERLELWAPRTWPREPVKHQLQDNHLLQAILTLTAYEKLKKLSVSSQQLPTDPPIVASLKNIEELEIREPFSTSNLEQGYHKPQTVFWSLFTKPLRRLRVSVLSHQLLDYLIANGRHLQEFELWCNDVYADIDGITYEFRYHDLDNVQPHAEVICRRFRSEMLPVLTSLTHLSLPMSIRRRVFSHTEEIISLESYLAIDPDPHHHSNGFRGIMQLIHGLPKLSYFKIYIEGTTLIKGCTCLEHAMPDLSDGLGVVERWLHYDYSESPNLSRPWNEG